MALQAPVPEGVLTALGRVTVYFSLLESTLGSLAGDLVVASNDQRGQRLGQIVTADLSFSSLVKLTEALSRYRSSDETQTATLVSILKRASAAEQRRNELVHAVWAVGDKPDGVTRMKATAKKSGKAYHFVSEPMDVHSVNSVADDLAQVAEDILLFRIGLMQ